MFELYGELIYFLIASLIFFFLAKLQKFIKFLVHPLWQSDNFITAKKAG